ncbi:MAG TPA: fatty acyl-AMP ligase [Polyangiaceae bacterium]
MNPDLSIAEAAPRGVEAGFGSPYDRAFLPEARLSFPGVVGARMERHASDVFFWVVEVSGRELKEQSFSYAEIDRRVRTVATALAQHGATTGDRVLLSLARLDEFFVYFLAAQALGAIPVPLPAAAEYEMPSVVRERVRSVASDCRPRILVADSSAALGSVASDMDPATALLDASAVTESAAGVPHHFSYDRRFDEIAFIQYTSGSTGEPKGVVVNHGNLVANLRASAEAARFGASDVSFSWLPMYHDMGLIGGLLQGTYLGIPTYVMLPRHFVRRPESWLRAITRYRVTYTVAPNFAYSIAARRLPERALEGLELSCLRLAFNGAEPIDRSTVEAFIERFERFGFRRASFFPVYGLAECTLAAAFPEPGSGPVYDHVERKALALEHSAVPAPEGEEGTIAFVSCGKAMPDHTIQIVNPDTREPLAERRIGEIVVFGPSVSRGYYDKQSAAGGELRTGDLGYIAEGRLYVVDRLKDLVIIAGRNIIPSDVERAVGKVPGVWPGAVAVFGVAGKEGTEDLVVLAGIDRRARPDFATLREAIRRAVFENQGIPATDVCLTMPGNVPKTSSGKVQRSTCRRLFETKALKLVVESEGAA